MSVYDEVKASEERVSVKYDRTVNESPQVLTLIEFHMREREKERRLSWQSMKGLLHRKKNAQGKYFGYLMQTNVVIKKNTHSLYSPYKNI